MCMESIRIFERICHWLIRYPVDQGVDPNDSPQVPEEVEGPDAPYLVVIYNDDVTPMDYVFELLFAYLPMSQEEAFQMMLRIHNEGQGIVSRTGREEAQLLVRCVERENRIGGFSLRCGAIREAEL
ncbi:hypothetical protein GCM10022265_37030 [Marinobacter xestospongiae]